MIVNVYVDIISLRSCFILKHYAIKENLAHCNVQIPVTPGSEVRVTRQSGRR